MFKMSRNKIFLVGTMNNQITGSKLPSKRNCLSVLYYNMRNVHLNLNSSALLTIDECLIYWKKARIPNQDRDNCAKKLKKLYEDLRSLEKNKTKIGNLYRLREKQFEETLDDLFDIAHSNAMNTIKIDEDKEFLLLQRQKGRVGCMLGRDIKLAEKEQRKATREDAEYKRKNIQQNSGYLKTANILNEFDSDTSEFEETIIEEPEIELNIPSSSTSVRKRARREILTPRLSACLDKCKISDRDAVHLITACIEAVALDINDFAVNRTSIRNARQIFRKNNTSNIKSKFIDLNLNYGIVHWDSKILPTLVGKDKCDRLPVVITALKTEQLLGVPHLSRGTGNEICSAVYDELENWGLLEKIQGFVFDTTASNSGRLSGACVLLEQKLGRNVLFLACRHHIFEIILQAVFIEAKFAPSSGPDIPLFKRFIDNWKNINKNEYSVWTDDSMTFDILNNVRDEVLDFAEKRLQDCFPSDDYKEFLQLIVIFLGGKLKGNVNFRQPGAYHLARWMAKGIYSLKILLFKNQFKLTSTEEMSLKKISCFIIKCYAEVWFTAPNAIKAPINDILFIKKLYNYKNDDKKIAETALKKFINHLWYLSDECVAFSIFDNRVTIEQKRKMAIKMLMNELDEYEQVGEVKKKHSLKIEDIPNFIHQDLPVDLITYKSIQLLNRFNIQTNFLLLDPKCWEENEEYKKGKEIIGSLKVVNDTAERHVKLMEEFNSKITKNEEQKQFLLQTVQDYRRKYPNHNRETMCKPYKL
ncbi:hypothetical protein AGLY_015944 [Aphis glycines]|uniref:Uncharacterized protein n=1 Tax=Aphis glycines TaxID=307491 RepID=A0A6G0SYQ7_APHGL|nr:hypothetical protein AGLY_015944 [Aphis glycines]